MISELMGKTVDYARRVIISTVIAGTLAGGCSRALNWQDISSLKHGSGDSTQDVLARAVKMYDNDSEEIVSSNGVRTTYVSRMVDENSCFGLSAAQVPWEGNRSELYFQFCEDGELQAFSVDPDGRLTTARYGSCECTPSARDDPLLQGNVHVRYTLDHGREQKGDNISSSASVHLGTVVQRVIDAFGKEK